MKKLTTLLLAAGLVFAAAAPASAVDIKMDGEYIFQFDQAANKTYADQDSTGYSKSDYATQRVRIGMTASVSENLSGYFQVDSKWEWGSNDTGATTGTAFDGAKIDVRLYRAYIDWTIPSTPVKVRMGRQDIKLPAMANGKNVAIWSKDPVDGITVTAPITDWASLTGFWGRYVRANVADTAYSDEVDAFGVIASLKFDGFQLSPYLVYALYGDNAPGSIATNNNASYVMGEADIFWAGISGSVSVFDPFTLAFGFVYGDRNYNDKNQYIQALYDGGIPSQHGWVADIKASYKTGFGTPSILAWYGTGDDSDALYPYQGHMPSVGGRNGASKGFFNGFKLMDNNLSNNHNLQGSWGIRLGMDNMSFLEGLTHSVALVYAQGTNDKNNASSNPTRYLTEEDSLVEIDFDTTYQIYKNLSVIFEAAYVIENFEETIDSTRVSDSGPLRNNCKFDNGWRAGLQFTYKF